MALSEFRVQVEPGDGVLTRSDPVIVLAFPESDAHDAALDALIGTVDDAVSAGGSDVGRKLVRRVVGQLARADVDDIPDFALVVSGDATAVLINGDVDVVVVSGAGEERLSGRSVSSWLDRVIDAHITELRLHRSDRDDVRPARRSDLRSGSVPAGGVLLAHDVAGAPAPPPPADAAADPTAEADLAPPPPPPSPPASAPPPPAPGPVSGEVAPVAAPSVVVEPLAPPEQEPEPQPEAQSAERSFESIALTEANPEEESAPLPIAAAEDPGDGDDTDGGVEVRGILCSRQHFNDPSAAFCSACGISMVHQTHNLVTGIRPPLGVLLSDDGAAYALDGDYVIGREPEEDASVRSGEARALPLPDPERTISRAHARVMLDEWDVRVIDLRSANGTHVAGPDETEWTPLHPGEPCTLKPGSRVLVGQRTFVYDSHHRR